MKTQALAGGKLLTSVEDGGIGWITINQPERHNAISLAMWQALGDAATAFENDPSVRVVVLHGAGGKSFASGADISEFDSLRSNAEQKATYVEVADRGRAGLFALRKPLVAMIDGYCIGGGLALAMGADLRFASTASRFAIPAARLGLGYEYAGVAALARLVGTSVALDLLFSARHIDAEEAFRVGLINAVLPSDQLRGHVERWASQVAANAPLTLRAAKAAARVFERKVDDAGVAEVAELVDRCFDSSDYAEGRRAFAEKRAPRFSGS